MENKKRDRIYRYAKLYKLTRGVIEKYREAVGRKFGNDFIEEAEIAYEAIDQWEGDVNPRNK